MARTHALRIAVTGTALAALLVGIPLSAQAASSSGWRIVHRYAPGGYAFYTALAVSGSHAWAVGSGHSIAGYGVPAAAYFSHGRWSTSRLPTVASDVGIILAVSADSPDDAWALNPGAVLHWHHGRWSVARMWNLSGGPPGPDKTGITALSPTDTWVFGGGQDGNGTWPLHGKIWTKIKTAAGAAVYCASAVSATDMWGIAGAEADAIAHYSGGSWHAVSSPSLHGLQFGSIVATSATSVWVLASPTGKDGLRLLHLHGGKWTSFRPPWHLPLSAINGELPGGALSPDGHGGFWLTGINPNQTPNWLLHFSATGKWTRVAMGRKYVRSIAHIPGNAALWAVGSVPTSTGSTALIWAYGKTG
jgi:hypothetical protein